MANAIYGLFGACRLQTGPASMDLSGKGSKPQWGLLAQGISTERISAATDQACGKQAMVTGARRLSHARRNAMPPKPVFRNRESRPHFRLTRRGLLIGTGATLGLAVGYAFWPRSYPGSMPAPDGETAFGPWLRIAPDGRVTVAVPQAEMGQGVMSAFAQIVADELGANWQLMGVEPAIWHPTYANAEAVSMVADGLPGAARIFARKMPEQTAKRRNLQLTVGSTSIRNFEPALRRAAAQARQLLMEAAARQWGVAVARLDTRDSTIVYKANRMDFAEAIKLVDARQAAPAPVLRPVEQRTLAGKSLPRIDLPPKVDGRARLAGDVRIPGLIYAAIHHGPPGSRLEAFDAPDGLRPISGPDWIATTGRTNWEARRNLKRIKAEFALPDGDPLSNDSIHQMLTNALATDTSSAILKRGSPDNLPTDPDDRIEAEYALPLVAHALPEPLTATARLSAGRAEIWAPSQASGFAHQKIAAALDLPADAITIYPTLAGGGFGRLIEADHMMKAALIAQATGQPVQLTCSRAEDFRSGHFRAPALAQVRAGMGGTRIAAMDIRIATPVLLADMLGRHMPDIAPDAHSPNRFDMRGLLSIPYAIDNLRIGHAPCPLPLSLGYWRGGPDNVTAFILESLMDELAGLSGADPLEFRLQHLDANSRHARVLRAAARASKWGTPLASGQGRGMAVHESCGSVVAMVVTAGITSGRVQIHDVLIAIDCGPVLAPDSVRAQLEGAAIMGLSAALYEEIGISDGQITTQDFGQYRIARMADMPVRLRTLLLNSEAPTGGVSEAGLPPAAPALANALARATGQRARQLPLGPFYGG